MNVFSSIHRTYRTHHFLLGFLILSSLILASCDSGAGTTTGNLVMGNGGKGCTKIGILLPDITSSDRWEKKDHPLLIQAVKEALPDAQIDYSNARDSSATQIVDAQKDLANGDCILIVGPHDSVAAAPIVAMAKAQNVPVIAYDRLIQSKDLNYYVSFDNVKVGQLQAQYVIDHYLNYRNAGLTNTVMISGSQTDTNALLFSKGAHSMLDPLFADTTLKYVNETFTPNWDGNIAQSEMQKVLTDRQNDIQVAYVANDGMANGVITTLKNARLDGKVLVTGQDASVTGIHNILAGTQSMTVYKPIEKEAQSAGALVKLLNQGANTQTLTQDKTATTYDGGIIPSILDNPISVDIKNIARTVIADKFLTAQDVCVGLPVGTGGVC